MLFRLDTNYHFPLFVCMLKGSRSSKHIISFSLNINWTRELRTPHSTRAHQPLVQVLRLGLWLFVVNSFTLSWLPDRMERERVVQTSNNELTGTPLLRAMDRCIVTSIHQHGICTRTHTTPLMVAFWSNVQYLIQFPSMPITLLWLYDTLNRGVSIL